jgi:hypothetical protein
LEERRWRGRVSNQHSSEQAMSSVDDRHRNAGLVGVERGDPILARLLEEEVLLTKRRC